MIEVIRVPVNGSRNTFWCVVVDGMANAVFTEKGKADAHVERLKEGNI